jgi:hypothetical protein
MSEKILRGSLTQDENVLQGSLSGTNSLKGSLPQQTPATGVILNPEVIYGLSAYQIAVKYGYEGTEQEWLDSLVGGANEKEVTEIAEKVFDNKSVDIVTDIATIKQWIDNKDYVKISITSFSATKSTYEMGETVTSVTLNWQTNKTPTSLTFDGASIGATEKSKTLTGLSITKDSTKKSWTLVAADDRGETSTKTAGISFLNGVYYGVMTEPSDYTNAETLSKFILDAYTATKFKRSLTSSRVTPISVTAGKNEYIYYCLPSRIGKCVFEVRGNPGGFRLVSTFLFKNKSGYSEEYYLYRSNNPYLGYLDITVKEDKEV